MIYYFLPYTHISVPPIIDCRRFDSVTWELSLHKSLLHWFNKKDWDHDWRKACGVKRDYFNPRELAVMVGFRPAQDRSKRFELTPYVNLNKTNLFPSDPIIFLDLREDWSESCKITISRDSTWKLLFENNSVSSSYEFNIPTDDVIYHHISPWYGGQATARRGMRLKLSWT